MNIYRPILLLSLLAATLLPSVAEVDTITFCDSLPAKEGGWSDRHILPLFDPTMGELLRVDLSVDLVVTQDFQFENEGPAGATVDVDSVFELSITMPDSSNITAAASSSISEDLAGFDGEVDFSGPSGRTIKGLASTGSVAEEYLELAAFVATIPDETINLPARALANSKTQLSGNTVSRISSLVGSKVCVTYTYDADAGGEGR